MESLFQNCVTDFDLNLFEQTTNTSRATPSAPCPVSRKLGIARLKDRVKAVSRVVHKAKNTNEILLEAQKELSVTKQELEETRNLLFEKNEEHKVICDERSVYFDQVSEYSNEIQNLKERLKKFEQLEYDIQLKDKIINGYSEQMKGLQTEMEHLEEEKKQSARETSIALKQAKTHKALAEKQLVKLLKHYVMPTTKKRNRWLTSIINQYLPETQDDENEMQKVDKLGKIVGKLEETDLEEDEPSAQALVLRNSNTELDCVSSVDTGRGSSLEFSDGEKSFHSPDYYINDSPHCTVTNVCNKCNVLKSDVSTSTMCQETSNILETSVTNATCKKCALLSRKDACTSPMPSLMLDAATDTTDSSFEITSRDRDHTHKEKELSDIGIVRTSSCSPHIEKCASDDKDSSQNTSISKNKIFAQLQDLTFDSDEEDDEMVDADSRSVSSVGELNILPTADFDEVVKESDRNIPTQNTPLLKLQNNDDKEESDDNANNIGNFDKSQSQIFEDSHISLQNEVPTLVKIQITAASDTEDDEPMQIVSRTASPIQENSIFSPVIFDHEISGSTHTSSKPLIIQTSLCNRSTDLNITVNRSTQQEKECLELNNSNNSRDDAENDSEIQTILNKMRLHHQFITPIPETPKRLQSPKLPRQDLNTNLNPQVQLIAESINAQIDLLRSKVQEVFNPFVESLPLCLEQIPRLFCNGQQNEELLRNLMFDLNQKKTEKTQSLDVSEITCNNHRQPDVVDLNSGSMLTITNIIENEDHDFEELSNIEEDVLSSTENAENVDRPTSSNCQNEEVGELNAGIPEVLGNNLKNSVSLLKVETSERVHCVFDEANLNSNESNAHKSTHALFDSEMEYTHASATSDKDTISNTIESRNSIVYEREGISDSDDDVLQIDVLVQNENDNSNKVLQKKKVKVKKLTKLEKLRKRMIPKGKIKADFRKSVKKPRFKPTPISPPVTKKRVTASDTAATMNDKLVYENAVKVVTAQRMAKEPRIIIEDCVRYLQNKSDGIVKMDDKNNNLTKDVDTVTFNKKRKISENLTNTQENLNPDSNSHSFDFGTKRKSTSVEEILDKTIVNNTSNNAKSALGTEKCDKAHKRLKQKSSELDKQICAKSPKENKQQELFNKSETISTKRTYELEPSDLCSAKVPKRKRTSIADHQNTKKNNNNNVELNSQRILRSSSHVKTKHRESEGTPIVARYRERLRSTKADQNHIDSQDTPGILANGRKHRISRVTTNAQQSFESTQTLSLSNTAATVAPQNPEISKINNDRIVSYADLDILLNEEDVTTNSLQAEDKPTSGGRKDSLLCQTIQKYGLRKLKFAAKQAPESKIKEISNKLETRLSEIVELPHDKCRGGMKKLVADIRTWDVKLFLLGFIKFLRHPERKLELFNKTVSPPAPPMTKKEQVLLYVIDELQKSYEYRSIVQKILMNIEYALFALNKTAEEFDVIEAMAHFYALLCRSYQKISKLRLFIIDAMYCLQLKSVILVQQCLEVWMLVLPLGHMGLAKCPLVTCLVYLLHFYKCEDKYNRVQDIRNTLRRKYSYDLSDWSETKILEQFKTAVTEVKEIPLEKKILRLSLLILAKRNGAVWCHNNIVKNILQPLIDSNNASDTAKRFAISLLGPLLKPYPGNMKVHCETIIYYLMDLLEKKNSLKMQEAIISSLICMDKNNSNNRLHRFLAAWTPQQVSSEFELLFINYVRSKNLHTWKNILSWQI